jgi:hypothetical protein
MPERPEIAGWLGARKARILLALLLGDRRQGATVADRLERYLSGAAPV